MTGRSAPHSFKCVETERRTFANWMVEAGVPLFLLQQMMGHRDTRMLERVYGRQRPEQVATALARTM